MLTVFNVEVRKRVSTVGRNLFQHRLEYSRLESSQLIIIQPQFRPVAVTVPYYD